MNRTFIAPLTPGRARLAMSMARHVGMKIDQQVIDMAEVDRIDPSDFAKHNITEEIDQRAIQFIIDANFRAGLPTPENHQERRLKIIKTACAIAGEEIFDIQEALEEFRNLETTRWSTFRGLDFRSLVNQRNKVAVLSLDSDIDITSGTVSKFFPRLILHGNMRIQYAFTFSNNYSSVSQIGELLYPSISNNISTPYKKSDSMSILACGCFPDFLEDVGKDLRAYIRNEGCSSSD